MRDSAITRVRRCGEAILRSEGMQRMRTYKQHGSTSVFAHCVHVACMSVRIAERLHLRVNERAMIRGALLHDYFLYDWHDPDNLRPLHGFTHPGEALRAALEEFELNDVERNVIHRHMFPLTPVPPRYREAVLVSLADKVSAVLETFGVRSEMRVISLCRGVR